MTFKWKSSVLFGEIIVVVCFRMTKKSNYCGPDKRKEIIYITLYMCINGQKSTLKQDKDCVI